MYQHTLNFGMTRVECYRLLVWIRLHVAKSSFLHFQFVSYRSATWT